MSHRATRVMEAQHRPATQRIGQEALCLPTCLPVSYQIQISRLMATARLFYAFYWSRFSSR